MTNTASLCPDVTARHGGGSLRTAADPAASRRVHTHNPPPPLLQPADRQDSPLPNREPPRAGPLSCSHPQRARRARYEPALRLGAQPRSLSAAGGTGQGQGQGQVRAAGTRQHGRPPGQEGSSAAPHAPRGRRPAHARRSRPPQPPSAEAAPARGPAGFPGPAARRPSPRGSPTCPSRSLRRPRRLPGPTAAAGAIAGRPGRQRGPWARRSRALPPRAPSLPAGRRSPRSSPSSRPPARTPLGRGGRRARRR